MLADRRRDGNGWTAYCDRDRCRLWHRPRYGTIFAALGDLVVAVDIDTAGLASLAEEYDVIRPVTADVSALAGVAAAVSAAGERPEVLCNNAGVIDSLGAIDEVEEAEWDRLMRVNLKSQFLFCQSVVPLMVARGGGVITNTASIAGLRAGRGGVAYSVSKFGVIGLTQNIAVTHGPVGIRCNAICPGGVTTNIANNVVRADAAMSRLMRDKGIPPEMKPEHVAGVAVFLAGEAAAHVNGAAIPVDDGWIAY